MKAAKLREESNDQLLLELNNRKEQLFHLRMDLVLGQLTNGTKIRQVRREIAQIKTILGERERSQAKAVGR